MKLKDILLSDRPRERLKEHGVSALSNAELLAIILQSGTRNNNVMDVSRTMLSKYSFERLSNLSIQELMQIKGVGMAKACQVKALFELARRINGFPSTEKIKINHPKQVYNLFFPILRNEEQENVYLLCLDSLNGLISKTLIFKGTLNESIVHPREIFKEATRQSACSIILVHNHPSGDPTPSEEDKEITSLIQDLSDMMNIKLVDHVVVATKGFFSFKERGLLDKKVF
jgi:DNA repair protein RadC